MAEHEDQPEEELHGKLSEEQDGGYVLHLYVAGMSPRSQTAIGNIKRICREHLQGRYELQIHDIYQNPVSAEEMNIIAAPTLIKELPLPLRRFVGDMSDTEKLLVGMKIRKNG